MYKSSKVRGWAIVGTGWIANDYVAPALKETSSVRLVAVHSRDRERGAIFATKHGIERSYDSYSEMLSDPEVDVVHIMTPNSLHASQTIQAAKAGKHVLCDKPMAINVEECEHMIEACRQNKVKLGIGFQMRYHPGHVEAHRLISSGKVGDITLVTAQYSHGFMDRTWTGWRADPAMAGGGGSLLGMGVHCLDLLRFLLEQEVEEVSAISDTKWITRSIEDTILINLKFENGPFGSVISGIHVPRPCNDLVIYGTEARIRGVGIFGMPQKGLLEVTSDNINERIEQSFPESLTGNYIRQAEAFNDCIDEDTEPNASGDDGLEMVRLALSILESAKQQRAVRIER